jgi:hypothetical protein
VIVGTLLCFAGCDKTPPPPADLSKTPWLDPKAQMEGLKNQDFRIRGLSAFNLGNMGAKAADAIPALEKLAQDDANEKVRENAREAVDKIRAATGGD